VLESSQRLEREIGDLVALIRNDAGGRYACLLDRRSLFMEDAASEDPSIEPLRRLLEAQRDALFRIPGEMDAGGPAEDVFAEWKEDEFLLAFLNRKVGLVVACPDAEALRLRVDRPLRVLVDRLLRWKSAYRLDDEGRGLFFATPKLDLVVVGRRDG
jgi:hypothetical protein